MKKPARLALGGLVFGLVLACAGMGADYLANREYSRLVALCETEHERRPSPFGGDDRLVCNPFSLMDPGSQPVGIQAELVAAAKQPRWGERPIILGLVVALLLSIPYLWYALLRRISELRHALSGRPLD